MGKQPPNLTIYRDPRLNEHGYIEITLDRPDKPKLGETSFGIHPSLFNRICKELGISTDHGALNRMEEIIEWLAEREVEEAFIEKELVVKY